MQSERDTTTPRARHNPTPPRHLKVVDSRKFDTALHKMLPRGLEPRTLRLLAVRSDQLSYESTCESTAASAGFAWAQADFLLFPENFWSGRTAVQPPLPARQLLGDEALCRPVRAESTCISGLVVEYVVAIDVTRVRFPADAFVFVLSLTSSAKPKFRCRDSNPGRSGESRVS